MLFQESGHWKKICSLPLTWGQIGNTDQVDTHPSLEFLPFSREKHTKHTYNNSEDMIVEA
jgi:hypothetical protein